MSHLKIQFETRAPSQTREHFYTPFRLRNSFYTTQTVEMGVNTVSILFMFNLLNWKSS